MIGKLISNMINRLDPKFTLIVNGKEEKYNSVMALKMRAKQLDGEGIKWTFRENW